MYWRIIGTGPQRTPVERIVTAGSQAEARELAAAAGMSLDAVVAVAPQRNVGTDLLDGAQSVGNWAATMSVIGMLLIMGGGFSLLVGFVGYDERWIVSGIGLLVSAIVPFAAGAAMRLLASMGRAMAIETAEITPAK